MANNRQQPITQDRLRLTADVTYFPVLITRTELDDEVVDPSGSNAARTDGGDLRFYENSNQTGELAREKVAFEHDGLTGLGNAVIEFHVSGSGWVLSSVADVTFYVEYGDGALTAPVDTDTYGRNNVWDSDFHSVLHLQEFSGVAVDSTGNGNDGTMGGSPTRAVSGPFGAGGIDFDGVAPDYISQAAFSTAQPNWSVEMWANPDSLAQYESLYYSDASGWNDDILIGIEPDVGSSADRWAVVHQDGGSSVRTIANDTVDAIVGTWYSLSFTADTSNLRINVNGANKATTAKAGTTLDHGTSPVQIGNDPDDSGRDFNGQVDEFRRSTVTRSADWIIAGYNNQYSPSTFFTAGTPVAVGADTALASSITGTATTAADLTTAINLLANVNAQATVAADLTTQINLAASANAQGTVAADLTTSINLLTAVNATGLVAADLTTSIPLAASLSGTATIAADLTTGATTELAASISGNASVAADLTTGISLAVAITGQATVAPTLTTGINLVASLNSQASVVADITTGINLSAAVIGQCGTVADLTTGISLVANLNAQGTVLANLFTGSGIGAVTNPRIDILTAQRRLRLLTPVRRIRLQ